MRVIAQEELLGTVHLPFVGETRESPKEPLNPFAPRVDLVSGEVELEHRLLDILVAIEEVHDRVAHFDGIVATANLDGNIASKCDCVLSGHASIAVLNERGDAFLGPLRGPEILAVQKATLDILLPSYLDRIRGESLIGGSRKRGMGTDSSLTHGLGYHLS